MFCLTAFPPRLQKQAKDEEKLLKERERQAEEDKQRLEKERKAEAERLEEKRELEGGLKGYVQE